MENPQMFAESKEYEIPIRTLYFTPVKANLPENIDEYFELFGEVESLRVHVQRHFQYGFVQFKTFESAEAVLSKKSHRIANIAVKIKKADVWHQPIGVIPAAEDSPAHILNALDDDCLRAVFRYFNIIDLCNAAEVCVRFNDLAKETFHFKYKNLDLRSTSMDKQVTDRLFRHFGPLIQSLIADGRVFTYDVHFLQTLAFSQTPQLKDLKLTDFLIHEKICTKLHPLFATLEKLDLDHCSFKGGLKFLLGACEKLKVLRLNGDVKKGKCIKQKFPMLEEVCLINNNDLTDGALAGFFTSNPTLTKVVIKNYTNSWSSNVFRLIGENLSHLTELNFNAYLVSKSQFQQDIQFLGQIKTLSILKLNFSSLSVAPLMTRLAANGSSIEHLCLYNGSINDEAVDSIARLKLIKTLKLTGIDSLTDLVELAKSLPQLCDLHLNDLANELSTVAVKKVVSNAKRLTTLELNEVDTIEIDVDDFKAMVKSIQNRPEKTKLLIDLTGDDIKVDVPDEILQENSDWVCFDKKYTLTVKIPSLFTSSSEYSDYSDYDYDSYDSDFPNYYY